MYVYDCVRGVQLKVVEGEGANGCVQNNLLLLKDCCLNGFCLSIEAKNDLSPTKVDVSVVVALLLG